MGISFYCMSSRGYIFNLNFCNKSTPGNYLDTGLLKLHIKLMALLDQISVTKYNFYMEIVYLSYNIDKFSNKGSTK